MQIFDCSVRAHERIYFGTGINYKGRIVNKDVYSGGVLSRVLVLSVSQYRCRLYNHCRMKINVIKETK